MRPILLVSVGSVWLVTTIVARADEAWLRAAGETRRATLDLTTGRLRPGADAAPRSTPVCWDSSQPTGYFTSQPPNRVLLDWGDLPVDCLRPRVFEIGYATDLPDDVKIDVVFYESSNGFNDPQPTPVRALRLRGLPHGAAEGVYLRWIITVIAASPIDLSGAQDLDGDGLADFGYSYSFRNAQPGGPRLVGPLFAGDPNLTPGFENAVDLFTADPNRGPAGPNDLLLPNANTRFVGTFWFTVPEAQFHMLLACGQPNQPCDALGCLADIHPPGGDGAVDLTDLAVLLTHFGSVGATRDMGDIEPPPAGDGDVDLADLSSMLGAFGSVCE